LVFYFPRRLIVEGPESGLKAPLDSMPEWILSPERGFLSPVFDQNPVKEIEEKSRYIRERVPT
jgi:hypothetical protein